MRGRVSSSPAPSVSKSVYEVLCGENRAALSLDGRVRRLNVVTGEVLLSLYCRVSDTLSDWATSGDFLTSSTKTEEVRAFSHISSSITWPCIPTGGLGSPTGSASD